ncbi:catalase [Bradyrhizobium sp. U87765 SZCCT0131]|uniref:catalase n=1 Tax=unclassified Bradyrhizobium TaxID=2631580 RepID=UPI001BA7D5C7|nr:MULTISPECIES: catalase [unclassified Bradyrhizobium]MBR1221478.1 catalase [Bradyrhizobium sp. U87765 SZCCT0131]MBR1264599.1 catalase [Bradyrhizobium sp. U87765 SZCCT0134]MBR1304495.1 catalase [Bradyrhizobium sp. U87765 SZCCT0110]MBR1322648.1 catalase [Bradyrhizobium sp. U87765 SZCCT0109]MBR1346424.1 catalase [Bradyrhizobium sp. U87765 SZCCT0048]
MAKSPKAPKRKTASDDLKLKRGEGGELHQVASGNVPVLTTAQGGPVSDDQNSLKIGPRGPTLLEDFHFREKIFHFDHERIPERVVHARGYGAHGFFENYKSLSKYTRADLFQRAGERTPAFVRFSTVAGSKGSPDLARDVRGFAVKLYTREGNWDIVGNNIPVFFIQDAIKFPDLIHAAKEEPDSAFPQAQTAHDNFWDFISLTPESMHMVMWIMSDRAIPRSLRFMEGFGVHTFRLVNAKNESTFVKFHWKPKLGLQSVLWNEAVKINGADPDFHRRDLWTAIQEGHFPEWELQLQLFDQKFADRFEFDILDPTKLIPEELLPPVPVGRLVLDRMPDNFFAETEQVAFMTQNVPPGIDFSNDPLLQGRNFSYLDTQLKRLGSANFTHLPINAPKCPFHHFQQDGHMAMRNPVGRANYQPNSFGEGPRESPQRGFTSFAAVEDGAKKRIRSESFADHYSQARQFYISQTPGEQHHIAAALTFELSKVKTPAIRERMVSHLRNVDEDLAKSVSDALGLAALPKSAEAAVVTREDLDPSPSLSIVRKGPNSFEGRKVGILVTDGVNAAILNALKRALTKEGATFEVIAPKVGGVKASDGNVVPADQMIDGGPSVLYDAVALLPAEEAVEDLLMEATARDFVADAFAHCKFIGYADPVVPLFAKAGIPESLDEGCIALSSAKDVAGFVGVLGQLRFWAREPSVKMK